jgi:hypothetical protein
MTITVSTIQPDLLFVSVCNNWGGQQLSINLNADLVDTIIWIRQYKAQLEREQQFRDENPVAKELFDQYTTYINLAHK